jgi:hypothetical protein
MSVKSPLVFVDGGYSELPPNDSIAGVQLGTLTAGSGVAGGGDLNTGSKDLFINLNPNPSGLYLTSTSVGLDGTDIVQADQALASGNQALIASTEALASGNVAILEANTALASGNAALYDALNFSGSPVIELEASTDIPIYAPVGIGDDAKAQVVRTVVTDNSSPLTYGTSVTFEAASTFYSSITYAAFSNYFAVVYVDGGNSNYGTAVTGRLTNSTLTWSAPVVFNSAATDSTLVYTAYNKSNGFIVYRDSSVSYYGRLIYISIGGAPGFGTPVTFKSQSTTPIEAAVSDSSADCIILFRDSAASNYPSIIAVSTYSNSNFNIGPSVSLASATANKVTACSVPYTREFLAFYVAGSTPYVRGLSIADQVISFTTSATTAYSSNLDYPNIIYDSEHSKFILFFASSNIGYYRVGSYDGSSITFPSSEVQFAPSSTSYVYPVYDSSNSCYVIAYAIDSSYGDAVCGFFDGSSLSFGTSSHFVSAPVSYVSAAHSTSARANVITYRNDNTGYGVGVPLTPIYDYAYSPTVSSSFNYIGLSKNATSSGNLVSVAPPKSVLDVPAAYNRGSVYYLDPQASGLSANSTAPVGWPSASAWRSVAKAVSSSGLLLLNPL